MNFISFQASNLFCPTPTTLITSPTTIQSSPGNLCLLPELYGHASKTFSTEGDFTFSIWHFSCFSLTSQPFINLTSEPKILSARNNKPRRLKFMKIVTLQRLDLCRSLITWRFSPVISH